MANNVATFVIPEKDCRDYFKMICRIIDEKHEEFPVNLDDVWPWVYSTKGNAVRELTTNFIEDIDYKIFIENDKNSNIGRPSAIYKLSAPCLEFFIARKKREVFEIYRQVFHAARRGELAPLSKARQSVARIQMLLELAQREAELEERQLEQQAQIDEITTRQSSTEERVNQIENRLRDNRFYTIIAFANIHKIQMGKKMAQELGKQCAAWCRRMKVIPEKIKSAEYGFINTYPIQALKDIFKANYPDKVAAFDTPTYWD